MTANVDQIEIELFKNGIFSIADEMAATIVRTAYSTVVRDNMDFSTAVTNAKGEVVAQGLTIAGHLGSIPVAIRHLLEKYGSNIFPGDVLILNDPYNGGMHLPDIFIFRPIFAEERLIAFAASVCHHSDVGGRVPGSNAADSTEIYQEGVRIPPLKMYERGVPNDTLMALLRQNVRMPEQLFGDLRSQLAAARVAERRLLELCATYGADKTVRYLSDIIDYAERMTRAAIAKLPDGVFSFDDWIDDDGVELGKPVPLKVKVTKAGEKITIDWTGSSPQVQGAINATMSFTQAASYCAVRSILPDPIPENEGMFRAIDVIAEKGSVLNVVLPGACAARGLTGFRMLDCLFGALAQMVPDRVFAASDGGIVGLSIGGYKSADRSPFVYVEFSSASWGGRPNADGLDGVANLLSNVCLPSVEVIESLHPIEIRAVEFVADTGGAGLHRGGSAIRREYRLNEENATLQVRVDRALEQPYGLYGGLPGASSINIMDGPDGPKKVPGKTTLRFNRQQRFSLTTGGGGGWGDPLARDPRAVFRDVADGFVTVEAARRDYAVILGPDGPDTAATEALRAERCASATPAGSFVNPAKHAA